MEPRISVLMGIYNCAPTLQEALDSLYAQTYQGFKIILCDDGSVDDTLKVAEENAKLHDNVLVIRNERNMGLNYTLNHCLEHADTEYVARMDGDDISLPTRFEKELKFLDRHLDVGVVSAVMIYFNEGGDLRKGKGKGRYVVATDFISGTPLCHAVCMARTAVFKQVRGYSVNKNLLRVEDYHLWFKIFAAGYKLYELEECLYKMRDDCRALSRRNWLSRRNEAYVKYIGYKMLHLPWYCQIYAVVPILKYFVPNWLYRLVHNRG